MILSYCTCSLSFAYTHFYYAEQWYSLFHRQLIEDATNYGTNIFFLKKALASPFGNPRFAFTPIENTTEWEKYRYLFYTHVNLKLIEQTLLIAKEYDVSHVRFFYSPFKSELLSNLEKSEKFYNLALTYWKEVIKWSKKAANFPFLELEKIQYWQDEAYRVENKELNYEKIIQKHLTRLARSREELNKLNEKSY